MSKKIEITGPVREYGDRHEGTEIQIDQGPAPEQKEAARARAKKLTEESGIEFTIDESSKWTGIAEILSSEFSYKQNVEESFYAVYSEFGTLKIAIEQIEEP